MPTSRAGRAYVAAVAAALAFLTGCADKVPSACTASAARTGIGLDIAPLVADRTESAAMRTCWTEDRCQDWELELTASTAVADSGCTDEMCSAMPGATGSKNGFAEIPDLPESPVLVTLILRDSSGGTVLTDDIRLTPSLSYSHGSRCGDDGVQAGLVVTSDGAVISR
ncbi:hypothetical protein [Yinghuangia soli]|uniref:Secreted protein n=1 Tax=Yinghuangia soli TaxID=2908204 RepID=A0AA41Q5X4_9ACTN|nr:hypothetical protein [Yinghuangia soli]MCF2531866.1 hypothetical protein [Yinghuangia soli]